MLRSLFSNHTFGFQRNFSRNVGTTTDMPRKGRNRNSFSKSTTKKTKSKLSTTSASANVQPKQNRIRQGGVIGESFKKIKWWRTAPSDEGLRLDRFIQLQSPTIHFKTCNMLIRRNKITVGNRKTREDSTRLLSKSGLGGDYRIRPGEYIHINFDCLADRRTKGSKAERMKSHISQDQINNIRSLVIYRDQHFLALNKPSGLPVQGDGLDLVSMLPYLQEFPGDCANEIPRLVHRLDKVRKFKTLRQSNIHFY